MNLYEYRKQLALDGYTEEARSLLYLLQIEGWNESEKITKEFLLCYSKYNDQFGISICYI